MTMKIPLRLQGVDLRDVDAYDRIDPELFELSWEASGGLSLAVFYSEDAPTIAAVEAADWARRIEKLMPGVRVADVYDELVSISDIASRAGVAAEAVRLWASGKRRASLRSFPSPRQVVGSASAGKARDKTMSLYAWRDVVSWIRDVIGTDPDEGIEYLTDAQLASLNARIVHIHPTATKLSITAFNIETDRVIADVQRLCAKKVSVSISSTHLVKAEDASSAAERRLKLQIGFR